MGFQLPDASFTLSIIRASKEPASRTATGRLRTRFMSRSKETPLLQSLRFALAMARSDLPNEPSRHDRGGTAMFLNLVNGGGRHGMVIENLYTLGWAINI
jgi:hypothetical protein